MIHLAYIIMVSILFIIRYMQHKFHNRYFFFFLFSYRKIKLKVWDGRLLSPLFNTQQYTLDLEKKFYEMWRKYEAGNSPDHI